MGRLSPGVSMTQAYAAPTPRFESWVAATATGEKERKSLPEFLLKAGGGSDNLRRRYLTPLAILASMVGLILVTSWPT
jgi:hypothetical protein